MAAARRAWKSSAPKIKDFCQAAARRAVSKARKAPTARPVKINERAFVDQAVRMMSKAVAAACRKATGPVVKDGATKAAQHDADYNWQMQMGNKEAIKVCRAAVALYSKNARAKATEMVNRTFHETSSN